MEKIQIELMNEFKYLSNLKSNKSKTMFTFNVRTPDVKENRYLNNLYLYKDNQSICLIENDTFTFNDWLTDDSIIIKRKNKDDDDYTSTFFKLTLGQGEAKKLFSIPLPVLNIKRIDDENYLIHATINTKYPDLYLKNSNERKQIITDITENNFKVEIEEIPFWENGGTYTAYQRHHLFIFNKNQNELTPIMNDVYDNVSTFDIDKNKIVYISSNFKEKLDFYSGIYEYDLLTKTTKVIYEKKDFGFSNVLYTKNYIFTLASDMKTYGINEDTRPYLISRDTNEMKLMFSEPLRFGNTTGSDARMGSNKYIEIDYETNKLLFISTDENIAKLMKYDGKLTVESDYNGSIDGFTMINNDIYTLAFVNNNLAEIYKGSEKITNFNDSIFENKYVATPLAIKFYSNGSDITGFVMLPENFDNTKKYKAILDIHGGPKTVYSTIYYHEMQVWVNLGYVVMFTNPHGSDGRGNEFSDIRGKYGSIDYQDLMKFVDVVLEKYPNIDENNLGVTGGSYGGFMTNWIITQTNRFKCAVTQRSISNWTSMYGVSDIGFCFAGDQNNTKFEDDNFFDTLWNYSPLKYIKNCKTPTLIIHADADYRCPIEQGYQLFNSLKVMGIDSKMIVFKDENHELSRSGKPKARISRLTNITNWFEKYLNG
ncbi:alpha/beta hydrolase family protein [Caviibacter abscessus]|uniref:alpha/beta hydrolase family protein n=1 Tax=Caviibacter abscessus TaxID=1766719 RepID=UPI00082F8702|nr:S9 family peptidase [Caviibacter abscessus]